MINIAGLKSRYIGKFLTVLLIDTPPSKYGNVGKIGTPGYKIWWKLVITSRQILTEKKGIKKIHIEMDRTFLILFMK